MARRSPESQVKRAREQNLREKREHKQAKKDARAAERRAIEEGTATPAPDESEEPDPENTGAAED